MDKSRIIMVDGKHSGWYEKAIFILTDKGAEKPISNDMVNQAERIVEEYLKRTLRNESSNKDYVIKNKEVIKGVNSVNSIKTLRIVSIISIILCFISILFYLL